MSTRPRLWIATPGAAVERVNIATWAVIRGVPDDRTSGLRRVPPQTMLLCCLGAGAQLVVRTRERWGPRVEGKLLLGHGPRWCWRPDETRPGWFRARLRSAVAVAEP